MNQNAPNPYSSQGTTPPLAMQQPASADNQGDATGGVIPYKNPKALIAYYLGILSGLPLIGLPLGIIALVLGVQGLQERSKNPVIKGSVHAWIGIGCGGIFAMLWGAVGIAIIMAIVSRS
ncbi:MAG: hypothetical protein MUC83_06090 [Pirellula sp.]|jgi:hypothetical protein|nr:hypothetical protein [Pirellula sp.]